MGLYPGFCALVILESPTPCFSGVGKQQDEKCKCSEPNNMLGGKCKIKKYILETPPEPNMAI